MGHDHHFLSRLDRVHAQHTELALSLYRDDELIRRILNMAEVPEAAERVAISLNDERRGPFIIVARDGHFVTCLGEGMGVKDAHVITRARLDDISKYISVLRERMEQARLHSGGETKLLMASVGEAGDAMTREQFRALLALTEMLRSCADRLMDGLDILYAARTYSKKPKACDEEALRRFWRLAWTHAHMQLVVGAEWEPGSPDPLQAFSPDAREQLSWCAVRSGWMPLAIRGIRTAAVAGGPLLDKLRSAWEQGERKSAVLHALFSMVAIAARDRSLAGEIQATLAVPPGPRSARADAWRVVHEMLAGQIREVIDSPEEVRQRITEYGREIVVRCGAHLPVGAVARFLLKSQVPEQLALARLASATYPALDLMEGGARLMMELSAWAGVAQPEDFYPDQAYVSSLHPKWVPLKTREMLECVFKGLGTRARPATGLPNQKPNEPCACKSGKKFKKCCGAVVTS